MNGADDHLTSAQRAEVERKIARNIRMRKGGIARLLTPDQEAEVLRKRAAGSTLSELAEEFGVSISVVWRVGNR